MPARRALMRAALAGPVATVAELAATEAAEAATEAEAAAALHGTLPVR